MLSSPSFYSPHLNISLLSPGLTPPHTHTPIPTIHLDSSTPGFQGQPQIFGQALANDLKELTLSQSTLLQYVDDLLLCSPSLQVSETDTITLLNFLPVKGYRVSLHKVR